MYYSILETYMCNIILVGDEKGLSQLHLDTSEGKRKFNLKEEWIYNEEFFKEIAEQIKEYFKGERREFKVKLNLEGTPYQKSVWNELQNIEFGDTKTYKEVAIALGNEKASRAVGMANSKNPVPLIIPCHRVIGKNGKLTGFAHGIDIKERLLNFEKNKK